MSKVSLEELRRIANMARLELEEGKQEDLLADMNKILDWMEQLNVIDTTGVEPLVYISTEINMMREDMITNVLSKEKGLLNAPNHDTEYFRVPKVLD